MSKTSRRRYETTPPPEILPPRTKPPKNRRDYHESQKGRSYRERGLIGGVDARILSYLPGPLELIVESLRADFKFLEANYNLAKYTLGRLRYLATHGFID